MYVEQLNDREKLLIIPMKDDYENLYTNVKAVKPLQFLLITQNSNGAIRRSDIMLFYPEKFPMNNLPENSFHDFFSKEEVLVDGTMTMLSIGESRRYEMEFKDGQKTKFFKLEKKIDDNVSSNSEVQICIQWYWVTTYYNLDGTTTRTSEYLGTTCGGCVPNELCDEIDGVVGSGAVALVTMSTEKIWRIHSQNSDPDSWYITTQHTISGLVDYNNPINNIITGITWNNTLTVHHQGNPAQCHESFSSCYKIFNGASSNHGYTSNITTATATQIVFYPNYTNQLPNPPGRTISCKKLKVGRQQLYFNK